MSDPVWLKAKGSGLSLSMLWTAPTTDIESLLLAESVEEVLVRLGWS